MLQINGDMVGAAHTTVDSTNTAIAVGSGSLPVFGTPGMIALMEEATCKAIAPALEDGETTVGTKIDVAHIKASGIGTPITATATLIDIDRRKLTFSVIANEDNGAEIGKGIIERFVVEAEKFMSRIGA
ncbi:MAG: thioesterase family protein [Eubacterium sp.]